MFLFCLPLHPGPSQYLHAALNDPNGTTASRSEVLFHLAYLDEQKGELAKAHNQYMSLASGIAGIPQPVCDSWCL